MPRKSNSVRVPPDKASLLLDLARDKFGSLTEAEIKLFKAVANGELADYSAEAEED